MLLNSILISLAFQVLNVVNVSATEQMAIIDEIIDHERSMITNHSIAHSLEEKGKLIGLGMVSPIYLNEYLKGSKSILELQANKEMVETNKETLSSIDVRYRLNAQRS